MRAGLIAAFLLFLPGIAHSEPATAERIDVATFAVDLMPRNPDVREVGRLRYLGGIVLRAQDRRFGGISGLRFIDSDTRLLGVSDRGNWVSFTPLFDGESLVGARDARLWPILDAHGNAIEGAEYDAESLTLVGDIAYVGFERHHRIETYANPLGAETALPARFRDADTFGAQEDNGSLEGLTTLNDGRLLAVAESAKDDSTFDGWIMDGNGKTESLALFAEDPFSLTDLATFPNGDVVTLERRFSPIGGVGARLRLIPADRINASALLDGEELANLGAGYTVDNMEGIAVREHDGRTEIFIISDDNQNPLQRTILMAFELLY